MKKLRKTYGELSL